MIFDSTQYMIMNFGINDYINSTTLITLHK